MNRIIQELLFNCAAAGKPLVQEQIDLIKDAFASYGCDVAMDTDLQKEAFAYFEKNDE
jgi:hypothetical protein